MVSAWPRGIVCIRLIWDLTYVQCNLQERRLKWTHIIFARDLTSDRF